MRWTAAQADLWVLTFKEGVLAAVAHDLKIGVGAFTIQLSGDEGAPTALTVEVEPESLRVICAMRDGQEVPDVLSSSDRRDIEKNIAREVLPAKKFAPMRFVSSSIRASGDGWTVGGSLTLGKTSRRVELSVRRQGEDWLAQARLDQRDWGITPYRAMLGALKVAPALEVRARVPRSPQTMATGGGA